MSLKCIIPSRDYIDKQQPCCHMGAVLAATMVENSVLIDHGVSGCAITATHMRSNNVPDGMYIPIIPTGVFEADLVHGGAKKIEKILAEIPDKFSKKPPRLVWIITSCATSMVEDDIAGEGRKAEELYGYNVIALDTPGFHGGYSTGMDKVYTALVQRYAKETDKKKKGSINIIAPHLMGSSNMINDMEEMLRLLKAADIEVNCILTYKTKIKEVERFFEAEANYLLSPEELPGFERMCEEMGMENWGADLILPLGLANTEEWYLTIAGKFGSIDKAKDQLQKDMDRVKRRLKADYNASWVFHSVDGKHAGVIGDAPFAIAMARHLYYDLNARPTVIALLGESERAIETTKKQLEEMSRYLDLEVYENPTYLEYGNAIKKAKVDFTVGQGQDKVLSEGLRIPQMSLGGFYFLSQTNFIPWPYFGILGSLALLTEIARGIEGFQFERESWIARSFIR